MSKPITEQQKRFNDFKTELTALSLKYAICIQGINTDYFDLIYQKDNIMEGDYDVSFDKELQKYV